MSAIEYLNFDQVDPEGLLKIVNEDSLRTHLIDHPFFDASSLRTWMELKISIDAVKGCRIRAVTIEGELAGWCGIQPDDNGFESAIVISQKFWGFGIPIFKTLLNWASELGHEELVLHLLETRPEYKSLNRISTKVHNSELEGRKFTTYHIPVNQWPT